MFAVRRSLLTAPRAAPRFTTSAFRSESLTDTVKEAGRKLNRAVGDTVLGGIEGTESLTEKATKLKDNVMANAEPLAQKAKAVGEDVAEAAGKKGEEMKSEAGKKGEDLKAAASNVA